jgi:transposase
VGHHSEAFVGIDTAKLRNAVAVAEAGRKGEVRYFGEVDTSEAATRRLVAGLAAKYPGRVITILARPRAPQVGPG